MRRCEYDLAGRPRQRVELCIKQRRTLYSSKPPVEIYTDDLCVYNVHLPGTSSSSCGGAWQTAPDLAVKGLLNKLLEGVCHGVRKLQVETLLYQITVTRQANSPTRRKVSVTGSAYIYGSIAERPMLYSPSSLFPLHQVSLNET